MIMEVLYMITILLLLAVVVGGIVGWSVLKELQRFHLLVHETLGNTQVVAASMAPQDFATLISRMPDIEPWRERDPHLDDSTDNVN